MDGQVHGSKHEHTRSRNKREHDVPRGTHLLRAVTGDKFAAGQSTGRIYLRLPQGRLGAPLGGVASAQKSLLAFISVRRARAKIGIDGVTRAKDRPATSGRSADGEWRKERVRDGRKRRACQKYYGDGF